MATPGLYAKLPAIFSSIAPKTFYPANVPFFVFAALIINVIALAAILFRLTAAGFTPNRTAVLGSNAIIFVHLLLISNSYLKFLTGKAQTASIHWQIASYLPVYSMWTAIVVFVFPFLFGFK